MRKKEHLPDFAQVCPDEREITSSEAIGASPRDHIPGWQNEGRQVRIDGIKKRRRKKSHQFPST
jgi:hypothetical protein